MAFQTDSAVARTDAFPRRSNGHSQPVITVGTLTIDLDTRAVEVVGCPVRLTGKEYEVLELLALRKGITLTKEMFMSHLYGGMDKPKPKIIDVFICNLRKKLAATGSGDRYIDTVWGRGYALRDGVREAASSIWSGQAIREFNFSPLP
jgi:two-component system cell cycle response regulator CtrA